MTDAVPVKLRRRPMATPEWTHGQYLKIREELQTTRTELSAMLDLVRAIIDQGALKGVPHLPPDICAALRLECHERIEKARKILE